MHTTVCRVRQSVHPQGWTSCSEAPCPLISITFPDSNTNWRPSSILQSRQHTHTHSDRAWVSLQDQKDLIWTSKRGSIFSSTGTFMRWKQPENRKWDTFFCHGFFWVLGTGHRMVTGFSSDAQAGGRRKSSPVHCSGDSCREVRWKDGQTERHSSSGPCCLQRSVMWVHSLPFPWTIQSSPVLLVSMEDVAS